MEISRSKTIVQRIDRTDRSVNSVEFRKVFRSFTKMKFYLLGIVVGAENYKCKSDKSNLSITCYGKCTFVIATDIRGQEIEIPKCDCGAGMIPSLNSPRIF